MFANRLKRLRKNMGLTQKELAEILETTRSTIAGYESPSKLRMPNTEKLSMIASLFNVSVDYLLCRDLKNTKEHTASIKENKEHYGTVAGGKNIGAVTVKDNQYACLGILKGDTLICKSTAGVTCGNLVVAQSYSPSELKSHLGIELVFIQEINNEIIEVYCPIRELPVVLNKNQIKSIVHQIVHNLPSFEKHKAIKRAYLT